MTVGLDLKTIQKFEDRLLPILSSPLMFEGRQHPCATLLNMLRGDRRRQSFSSPSELRALQLAAFYVRFAEVVGIDFRGAEIELPLRRRLPRLTGPTMPEARWQQIRPASITIESEPLAGPTIVPVRLREWLSDLPRDWIDDLLSWAAPVVDPESVKGPPRLVGNWIAGFIARTLPDELIRVRYQRNPPRTNGTLLRVCLVVELRVRPLIKDHEYRIIRAASTLERAVLLSGFSRSHCAEVRSR